jgi:uncharacterized protein (TIGR03086 family)
MDIRELDRRAVAATEQLVNGVQADQLDVPTPCTAWTLRQLVEHMIGQHEGFALAASGAPSDLTAWRSRPVGSDPARTYAQAAALVTAAFAEPGVLDRDFWLPEIRHTAPFPARAAIGFHFLDYVVHAWDVAKALGVPPGLDDDLLQVALALAEQVPDNPKVRGPRSQFQPGVPVPSGAPVIDRIVGLLGRQPDWSAS